MNNNFWKFIYFSQKLTKFQVTTEKDNFFSLNLLHATNSSSSSRV